ncbi:MAG TPA: hypothetical protein VFY20_00225 [Gemmatimonadales bacterium]|nr:hypothetical protein [Gemmatimonadales bacterium]
MKKKSAMVAAAMLLAGVATAANAQQDSARQGQDTSRAGQRQQVSADTTMQRGDSAKLWGPDSAPPAGGQGKREQDAVNKKNAAPVTRQDSLKADSTNRTGMQKTQADSVSGQANPSGAQRQQSSNNEWQSTTDSARQGRDTSSSYSNPSSPSGTTTTTTTPSTTSSRKMTKDEIRAEREAWFRNVSDVSKDQELSKNAPAPGAGAGTSQQSVNTPDASQQSSGTDASVQRSPEQSPEQARENPSATTGNQNPQAEYTDSTRRYVPRDSASPQGSTGSYSTPTSPQSSSSSTTGTSDASSDAAPRGDVTNATDPHALNPTGTGNNQGTDPESTRPEKMSSSTTGQQANASNRSENNDNATTKEEVGGVEKKDK